MTPSADKKRAYFLRATLVGWSVAVVGVWAWTTSYGLQTYTVGETGPPHEWPSESSLGLAPDRPTLVYFLHPRCPCTRASTRQLERTLAGAGLPPANRPDVVVVASLPPDASREWRCSSTVRGAAGLPGARVHWDVGGVEADRFRVVVSGAAALYREDGRLLFSGGVTSSRGHEGDSAGSDRLAALLRRPSSSRVAESTPVFGCRLYRESDASALAGASPKNQPSAENG